MTIEIVLKRHNSRLQNGVREFLGVAYYHLNCTSARLIRKSNIDILSSEKVSLYQRDHKNDLTGLHSIIGNALIVHAKIQPRCDDCSISFA